MKITGIEPSPKALIRSATKKPTEPGIHISEMIRSGLTSTARFKPSRPSEAVATSYPAFDRRIDSAVAIRASSSITKIFAVVLLTEVTPPLRAQSELQTSNPDQTPPRPSPSSSIQKTPWTNALSRPAQSPRAVPPGHKASQKTQPPPLPPPLRGPLSLCSR